MSTKKEISVDFVAEFNQVAKQMQLDFERARRLSRHPGIKGDTGETIVRSFLSEYLPKNLEISTGQIFDTNGKVSRQLDIIIHDRDNTPVLYLDKNKRNKLIPVECVYSVLEVKSFLDKRELQKHKSGVFVNMESVRALEKKAFYPGGVILRDTNNYGQEWTDWPINYYVFAFDSIRLEKLKVYVDQYHSQNNSPPEKRIDTICVLGKGLILNRDSDGTFSACPSPTTQTMHTYTQKELLLFYTLVSHFLLQATMRNFRFIDYIRNIKFD